MSNQPGGVQQVVAFGQEHLLPFGKAFADKFQEENVPVLSSSLAYFTVFSLFPLLLIIISITSALIGSPDAPLRQSLELVGAQQGIETDGEALDAESQITQFLSDNVSPQVASQITSALDNLYEARGEASLIGIVTLLFAASGVFASLDAAFQRIWDTKAYKEQHLDDQPGPVQAIINAVTRRVIAIGLVFFSAVVLLLSMVATIALGVLRTLVESGVEWLPPEVSALVTNDSLWWFLSQLVSFGLLLLIFLALFRLLPEIPLRWRDVLPGAAVSSLLFVLFLNLSSLLIGGGNYSSYGAVGTVMTLLLWVFFSSMALYAGVVFSAVYTRTYGSLRPAAESPTVEAEEETDRPSSVEPRGERESSSA